MTLRIHIVVGNPRPASRTRAAAEKLIASLVGDAPHELEVVELADYTGELFDWNSQAVTDAVARVADSDLLVIASPTYKAAYTGLLKVFLDRYDAGDLAGVVAIPLHTGGGQQHTLGVTHTLVPLLLELGAVVPGNGLYVVADTIDDDAQFADAAATIRRSIQAVAALAGSLA